MLTTDVISTSTLSGTPTMILTDGVFPASTVLTTDRIVVKVKSWYCNNQDNHADDDNNDNDDDNARDECFGG